MKSKMKTWIDFSYLSKENQKWIEWIYKNFIINPNSIEKNWHFIFQKLFNTRAKKDQFCTKSYNYQHQIKRSDLVRCSRFLKSDSDVRRIKIFKLINAYRLHGHKYANLDPLKLWKKEKVVDLDPSFHELSKDDFQENLDINNFTVDRNITVKIRLENLIKNLHKTYCGSIGVEYMHISSAEEKIWIQKKIESVLGCPSFSDNEKKRLLSELTAAEELERYLNTKFPGIKRFSLEGSDALIPMLKEILRYAGNNGIRKIVFGMTHRGRINMLVNVFGKKSQDLFDEFLGKHKKNLQIGDVKYHMGFSSNIKIESNIVHLILISNPSHLEIVNPVVMGSVRAYLDRLKTIDNKVVLPIAIHGDASIIGQGVVQETLNMSKVHGYEVGGTIHIIVNNQIGFTTSNFSNTHFTQYCTDIGKIVQAPVFHVNADDPEAVLFVARLALDFRNFFKKDVFIDLVCYRRRGHHEFDEPSVTQPIMYKRIKKHPTSREIYVSKLESEKVINLEDASIMVNLYHALLDKGERVVKEWYPVNKNSFISPYLKGKDNGSYLYKMSIKRLKDLAKRISMIPKTVKMQSCVKKIYADRQDMAAGKKLFDWGSAENLAYASLVSEGISVRLSGEDSSRGTFFHRHAVIHDQNDGSTYIPLQNVCDHQGQFNVLDSILSEEAVLAFEYGYSITEPGTLTIWEAQFGDFANGAQIVIDQFISSGEKKWGYMCGLVMLLPHGYEGQGPEHSSARLERYLQLCADQNMRVCVPSTPAQFYHILRRQALGNIRRPLIVISPKSLLRHPLSVSSFDELAFGTFLPVITELDNLAPKFVKRVIMCSGKIYYDLLEQRRKNNQKDIVIIRIEQLYPFPYLAIKEALKLYVHVYDFIWCQEEPMNQGAWYCIQHYFRKVIPLGSILRYIGRPASSSTAVGYMYIHKKQQQDLINGALKIDNFI